MNNPLENFKNPFDIDGSFAQKILNTDRIFGNTNKILGIPEEEKVNEANITEESFFYSFGVNPRIERYEQARKGYGLECNYTTLMYMLQSYGLIPINMTRKEFEYYFTPLQESLIELNQKRFTFPKQDMFSEILGTDQVTCARALRGYTEYNSFFLSEINSNSKKWIKNILWKFKNLDIMPFFLNSQTKKWKNKNDFDVQDFSEAINNGALPSISYFEDGNTIFVGVTYKPTDQLNSAKKGTYTHEQYYEGKLLRSNYHYSLIVREPIGFFVFQNKNYYIFPADDAIYKKSFIIAPSFTENPQLLADIEIKSIFSKLSFLISSENTIRINYEDILNPLDTYRVTVFQNFALGVYS